MDKVKELIGKKPKVFLLVTGAYLVITILWKWLLYPSLDALWFVVGGVIGIYFLDAAEQFFALNPSPFRSIVFQALFAIVAFFVVTSSTGTIGSGLVLSLFLQMILWQIGELRLNGNLDSWYRMVAGSVDTRTERVILVVSAIVFLVETYIFVR